MLKARSRAEKPQVEGVRIIASYWAAGAQRKNLTGKTEILGRQRVAEATTLDFLCFLTLGLGPGAA
jgi:hypothetical protein